MRAICKFARSRRNSALYGFFVDIKRQTNRNIGRRNQGCGQLKCLAHLVTSGHIQDAKVDAQWHKSRLSLVRRTWCDHREETASRGSQLVRSHPDQCINEIVHDTAFDSCWKNCLSTQRKGPDYVPPSKRVMIMSSFAPGNLLTSSIFNRGSVALSSSSQSSWSRSCELFMASIDMSESLLSHVSIFRT